MSHLCRVLILVSLFLVPASMARAQTLSAIFNAPADVAVTANGYIAAGTVNFALNCALPTGASLTVVNNTGLGFIQGVFSNLAQGQPVTLNYGGINYNFVANYFGGTGNDLVLQWANTRPIGWGDDASGQLGNKRLATTFVPVSVNSMGVLSGKTVVSVAAGGSHGLGVCSDGTVAAWGYNLFGALGNNTQANSTVPVAVTTTGVLSGKAVIAVTAGEDHSLALCSDGTIAAWGAGGFGQLGNGGDANQNVPVAVNTAGVLSGKTVVAIAAGVKHSLALCSDGTVAAWGNNGNGQLGNNSTTLSAVPVAVNALGVLLGKTVIAVAAGEDHSLALCSDGTVAAWGYNIYGQLGNNSTTESHVPVAVNTAGVLLGKTVIAVAGGFVHSLALCSDGTVAAWGYNIYGQLGNNSTTESHVPVAVSTAAGSSLFGKKVTAISAGIYHSLALCSDGTVAAWGYNNNNALGSPSGLLQSQIPLAVTTGSPALGECCIQVASCEFADFNLGLIAEPSAPQIVVQQPAGTTITNGGMEDFGSIIIGFPTPRTLTILNNGSAPLIISGISVDGPNAPDFEVTTSPASALAVGESTTFTVTFTPTATFEGSAALHIQSNDPSTGSFTINLAGSSPGALAATFNSGFDVPVTGNGFNATGSTIHFALNTVLPTGANLTVINNTGLGFIQGNFSNLAQGQRVTLSYGGVAYHFVANYYGGNGNDLVLLWADSKLLTWGSNDNAQLGAGDVANQSVPTSIDVSSSSALFGKTVVCVASGEHGLAVCQDGTVAAWGSNQYGQLGNNSTVSSSVPTAINGAPGSALHGKTVIAAVAGLYHSVALCSDGTLAAWGRNNFGQLGDNDTEENHLPIEVSVLPGSILYGKTVVAVAGGDSHNLALCSDGTLAAWGSNSAGQLGNGTTINSTVPVAVTTVGTPLAGKMIVAVAAGSQHSMALCSDGTVAVWGYGQDGELGNGSTARSSLPVGITTAGVLSGKTVVSIVAGGSHNLALCSDGTVVAWGSNNNGQLGNSGTTNSSVPVIVNASATSALFGKSVVGMAAGFGHSLAWCVDGTIACWGRNAEGQLGNNATANSSLPVTVSAAALTAGERFATAASGESSHSSFAWVADPPLPRLAVQQPQGIYLTNGGTVNFGSTSVGVGVSLAFNIQNHGSLPLTISGVAIDGINSADFVVTAPPAASVDAGASTTLGVTFTPTAPIARNAVLHFGSNDPTNSAFNLNLTGTCPGPLMAAYSSGSDVPLTLPSFTAAGSTVNFTLNGPLPIGANLTVVHSTGLNPIQGTFTNLAQGQQVTLNYGGIVYSFVATYFGGKGNDLVLQWTGNRLLAWGSNFDGQLGDGSTDNNPVPTPVDASGVLAGKTIMAVATEGNTTLVLCADGTLATWGQSGSTSQNVLPVVVSTAGTALDGKSVVAITAGDAHFLALCSDGTVAAWGSNFYGELGTGNSTDSSAPVAVNRASGSALFGRTVIAVAAGGGQSFALCSDGAVAGWGYNTDGELGNGNTTQSNLPVLVSASPGSALFGKTVISLAVGRYHSLALCSDGTVAAWGDNDIGQLGNGSTTNSTVPTLVSASSGSALFGKTATALSSGANHSLALCADGTVAAWGYNGAGQLGNGSTTRSSVPVAVSVSAGSALAGKVATGVVAENNGSVALCSDGTLAAWGDNTYGQLGDPNLGNSQVPLVVNAPLRSGEVFVLAASGPLAQETYGLVASPPSPRIVVQQPSGTALTDSTVVNFGSTPVGVGLPLTFTVMNSGAAPLTLSGVTIDGVNSADFSVTTSPASSVAVGSGTTLTVTFTPAAMFEGIAALHIASNDPDAPTFSLNLVGGTPGAINATYNSAAEVPFTGPNFSAVGSTVNFSLNYAPTAGTNLTVVKNTGLNFIGGAFGNLAQGQMVTLSYAGVSYHFVANYYSGTGNDLVLQWVNTRLMAWGSNYEGELGNGTYNASFTPLAVSVAGTPLEGKTVIAVSASDDHSLALCSDGTMAAWGYNGGGLLGNGDSGLTINLPAAVHTAGTPLEGKKVIAISAGSGHNLALSSEGRVYAWGVNASGELGNNSTIDSNVPVAVSTAGTPLAERTVVSVATGENFSVALCSDGVIVTWGVNLLEQSSNGWPTSSGPVLLPTAGTPLEGKKVTAVSAGWDHVLALCSDGSVIAWGSNIWGQLGNGDSENNGPVAVSTAGTALEGKAVVAVSAGVTYSLALCSDGTVAAWGYGGDGEMGNNSLSMSRVPVAVDNTGVLSGKTVTSVSAGHSHCLALCSDGTLAAWGLGMDGELGDGNYNYSLVPVLVGAGSLASGEQWMVAATGNGASHNVALLAEPVYPAVMAQAVGGFPLSSVTLNASVNPDGSSTSASFQYGFNTNYGNTTTAQALGSGNAFSNFSATLTGLLPHTTYHYRITATNAAGTGNGADLTFTTFDIPPLAKSDTINNVAGKVNISVLDNDTDLDGDSLTIISVSQGHNGSVTTDGHTVTYTPGASFSSSDVFSYTVSDGFGGTSSAAININAAPLQSWRVQTFGADAGNPAMAGDDAGPNSNGICNLMEYALHGDAAGGTTGNSILPQASPNSTTGTMQLGFTRYQDRSDVTLTVQACDSLAGPWTNLAQSVNGAPFTVITTGATISETGSGNAVSVTVGDIYPMNDPAHSHRFMRLQVTRP